ncbi:hypothetical protein AC579_1528 [Pseudocercospora musae]|uniref:Uncharacterized protein n=1 Tax=Pseudocercospora musae TaxID=113226 RepID=A0A139IMJ2_9PEZI|nr:hypothetical protein AC579_1528 [Pseudocercospora musae]
MLEDRLSGLACRNLICGLHRRVSYDLDALYQLFILIGCGCPFGIPLLETCRESRMYFRSIASAWPLRRPLRIKPLNIVEGSSAGAAKLQPTKGAVTVAFIELQPPIPSTYLGHGPNTAGIASARRRSFVHY